MGMIIKNGTVIEAGSTARKDVLIEGEKISRVGPSIEIEGVPSIDADGKYLIPGGVDVHTHLDMPLGKIFSRDDFESGTRAAAFGGTTTILDYATQPRGGTVQNALARWHSKASGKASIDYGFHMILTELGGDADADIRELIREGVTSFKLFMAYPGTLMVDDETIARALALSVKWGGMVCLHAEDGKEIDLLVKQAAEAGQFLPRYHAATRPPRTEAAAVRRAVSLASKAGATLYVVHLSSGDALKEIESARSKNISVIGETCPQYLFLSTDDIARDNFEGAKFLFTPPVREKYHQEELWKGLGSGLLTVVATDHCPFNFRGDKELGLNDFRMVPNGAPGIENRLHLLYEGGVKKGKISLNRWVDLVSTAPAKIFGLFPKKGTIAAGSDADIVIWDPSMEFEISAKTHHMNVDHNLYEGMKISGGVSAVFSRGSLIVDGSLWLGRAGYGNFLKRGQSGIIL